jgi:hypothetical protein
VEKKIENAIRTSEDICKNTFTVLYCNRDMDGAVGKPYFAAAISLVLHSKSPMVSIEDDVIYYAKLCELLELRELYRKLNSYVI